MSFYRIFFSNEFCSDGFSCSHTGDGRRNEKDEGKGTESRSQKRKSTRSGNGLIDDWLELDKEFNEKGKRITDQFDDLVDFLVEG